MTCLIFTSFTIEDTPQVLLQALAMVKPFIVMRVGGIPNLIGNRETGLLVEAQNAQDSARRSSSPWIIYPKRGV
jgi:glycosyltransferase involved in cell wall biosynthesis